MTDERPTTNDERRGTDYRVLLAHHGQTHWWIVGMRRIAWAVVGELDVPGTSQVPGTWQPSMWQPGAWRRVLDVGCGSGWLLRELPAGVHGVGVDLRPLPGGAQPVVQAQAGCLPFPAAAFDLALALDLLEQRDVKPAQTLAEIRRVLRPGGRLLVRVPAHPWLLGPHDAFWGGIRRYRRSALTDLALGAGFRIRRLTYANSLLFLPEMIVRLAARAGLLGGADLWPMPAWINRLLLGVLSLEARWLRRRDLPVGLSLLCLAERPTTDDR